MADRAALVTGASSGIGLAIAHMLGEEGHALTVAARRPEKLAAAAQELRDAGYEVEDVPANMTSEEEIQNVVARHRERYGRLDVLVNNAGVGVGAPVAEHETKRVDMQLDLNLRAIILFYRECADLLRAAGAEHRNALVVNTASIAGKTGQAWLSVYSATKFAVVGWTQSMNKELNGEGIKSLALCPGFVETPMTEFIREQVPAEDMIRPSDVAEAVRFATPRQPGLRDPRDHLPAARRDALARKRSAARWPFVRSVPCVRQLDTVAELRARLERAEREAAAHQRQLERYAADLRESYRRERARAQQLRRSYKATVRALSNAVEARDAYTGKHAERVAAYGLAIARAAGIERRRRAAARVRLPAPRHRQGRRARRDPVQARGAVGGRVRRASPATPRSARRSCATSTSSTRRC